MFHSLSSPGVVIFLLVLGAFCVVRSIGSWITGLQLLIGAVLFGGLIGLQLGSGAIAVIFRDFFIILPLYAAFFTSNAGPAAMARLPGDFALGLCCVLVWLVISALNPTGASFLQVLIGIKVWVFYIPFVVVGMAVAARPDTMFRTFRCLLVCGMLVCAVGLLQAFLVRIIGYATTMTLFFGSQAAAAAATQGFAHFAEAGGIYRIPGTFSFTAQYGAFLYLFLAVAMIECNADPEVRFRRVGQIAVYLALLAGMFSGSRGQLPMFAAMAVGFGCFGLIKGRLFAAALVGLPTVLVAASAMGLDTISLFFFGRDLAAKYAHGFIFQQVDAAMQQGLFGAGIGSSTIAARYASFGAGTAGLLGFESYYAKIAAEVGIIGLVIFGGFLALVAVRTGLFTLTNAKRGSNAIIAPLAIYIASNLVFSFKGAPLDFDPGNIFNWLALGLIIGVDEEVRHARRMRADPSIGQTRQVYAPASRESYGNVQMTSRSG